MSEERGSPISILLVEDNPGDVRLTQEAFKEGKILNHMTVVWDGEEAMSVLRGEGEHAGKELPDLVLLDLNLPKKDGREVLQEMKADPVLKMIPVVVLTTSKAEEDVLGSYQHNANCYITKPVEFEKFVEVVESISNFWLTIVKLPTDVRS